MACATLLGMSDSQTPEIRHSQDGTYDQGSDEIKGRFLNLFRDPIYDHYRETIGKMSELAWKAFEDNHKAPFTKKAGPGYQDPDYELSVDWSETKARIAAAQRENENAHRPKILLISASGRNDHSCAGEISKSRRLVDLAREALETRGAQVEVLDLSEQTSGYGRTIYPCKACVSTAMPLCHWPCSCYPNHATLQVNDWMNDIYPMWVRAHGIMIITPVYWYQAPATLKLMIDRLVCADGGNPDPTSTQGKKAEMAKKIELGGWGYPRHLEGRTFTVVVHGDTAGVDPLRSALSSWLKDLHLLPAGLDSEISRYIGYYEPYATSHEALDKDEAVQKEVEKCAASLLAATIAKRAGLLEALIPKSEDPRPK